MLLQQLTKFHEPAVSLNRSSSPDSVVVEVSEAAPAPAPTPAPAPAPTPSPPPPAPPPPPPPPAPPPPPVPPKKAFPTLFERIVIQFYALHAHVLHRERLCQRELVRCKHRRAERAVMLADHGGDPDGIVASAVALLRALVGDTLDEGGDAVDSFETRVVVCTCFTFAWKGHREDLYGFWLPLPHKHTNVWTYHCLFAGCHQVSPTETSPKSLSDLLGQMEMRVASIAQNRLYACLFLHALELVERRLDALVAMDPTAANEREFGVRVVAGYVLVSLHVSSKTHDKELDRMLARADCVIANVLLSIAVSLLRMAGGPVAPEVLAFVNALDPGTMVVVHQALRCLCACAWLPPLEEGSQLGNVVKAARLKRLKTHVKAELKKWYG